MKNKGQKNNMFRSGAVLKPSLIKIFYLYYTIL